MQDNNPPEATELAWAAGFFDGEGWCGFRKSGSKYILAISIGQTHPQVLERFKNAVGVGSVNGPYTQKNPNANPVWKFHTSHKGARQVIARIWPYLSYAKQAQMQRAFDKQKRYKQERVSYGGTI